MGANQLCLILLSESGLRYYEKSQKPKEAASLFDLIDALIQGARWRYPAWASAMRVDASSRSNGIIQNSRSIYQIPFYSFVSVFSRTPLEQQTHKHPRRPRLVIAMRYLLYEIWEVAA